MRIRIGKVLGIPITIDASWFIIFALIAATLALGYFPRTYPGFSPLTNWTVGIVSALLLFLSVLIHELAHSMVARSEEMEVGGITLFIFGGVSQLTEEPRSAWNEFKMAAAGPGMSLVLGAFFWGLGHLFRSTGAPPPVIAVAGYLAGINVLLAIFNLIPGFPLDGGRVLRAILWGGLHDLQNATRIASYVGQGFGYLFMLFGFWSILAGGLINGVWLILIGWFLNNAAQSSYQQLLLQRALEGVRVDRIMNRDVPMLAPQTSVEEAVHDFFLQKDYNAFPVVDSSGEFVGVVTLEGIRSVPREQWATTPVSAVTHPPEEERVIRPDEDAWEAMSHLATSDSSRLLVMADHKILGTVTRDNLMNLVRAKLSLGMT